MSDPRAAGPGRDPADELIPARAWAVLAVCSATVVLTLLDSGSMFVAFPFIEERFEGEASRATLSWVVTAFFIVMVSSLLVAGRIADRVGRRRTFLTGLALYAIGSIIASVTTAVWLLISARVVQGVGVALLSPSSIALMLPEFPQRRRAFALGVWGTIGAAAGLASSPVGAALVELFSWRAVFVFNGAVALAVLVAGVVVLDDAVVESDERPIDVVGALLATMAVGGLTIVLVQGNDWGWDSLQLGIAAAVAVAGAAVFLRRNQRSTSPLLDMAIFGNRRFAIASVASVCCQLGFFSVYFGVPLYMQEVWEWSPLQIGLGLLPFNAVPILTAAAAGRIVDRRGPRGMIAAGGVGTALVYLIIGLWLTDAGYAWLAVALGVSGLGAMMIGNHTTVAALYDIDDEVLGAANAAYFMTRRLGSALGAVAAAAIVGNRVGAEFADVYVWVWMFGAAVYFVGGMVVWLWYPRDIPGAR